MAGYDGLEILPDTTHDSSINAFHIIDCCNGFAVGNDGLVLLLGESDELVPALFQQFAATVSEQSIVLVWEVQYDAAIEAFHLHRWESTSPGKILSDRIDPAERSYTDHEVRPGIAYHYLLVAVEGDGHETRSQEISATVPVYALELLQNHPNPFNPYTTIRFRTPNRRHVELAIYSVTGSHVVTLFDAPCEPGETSLEWDGRDASGNPVGSGIYFYRLKAGTQRLSKKMVLLR